MAEGTRGPGADADPGERAAELAANLARVEERLGAACAAAGRAREEVTLVVVTKTYPASDVRLLADLGVRHVAENRHQEAGPKAEALADLPLVWHFVGQLQTNKARAVAGFCDYVHSVDRIRLVDALASAARNRGRELRCLLQVALDKEGADAETASARGGVAPADVDALAAAVTAAPGLSLAGVMTVAPLTGRYAGRPGAAFARLEEISSGLRRNDPAATMVSAGMSSDLEEAVAAGATHVRVGTAVLGVRPRLG
ncbi:YggS family pyridoxal phosphate-dependent enzyme [Streptomyces chumphonensis]|uniref:Pyridoxal phosphate homeostasis protein n=1 Tax=Streptomyces chumphonensis TaxID=1214925 RepID=A0A927IAU2_9ACTN|nr:YggS family pyridoxal phosphate-dependent enzyme [Streptomyces chumphonensis]MBD3930227.1 YggS family pyridoxal phosphate-dependent enzyme [Streptomyces chumphonensis]